MGKTYISYNFGCRVNEAEKQEIDRQMAASGHTYCETKPDICIINTCAVTGKAEREARQKIYQFKKSYPNSFLIITGCSATYWLKNSYTTNLPVDLIIDNLNKEYLVKIINSRLLKNYSTRNYPANKKITNKFVKSGRYLLKIQDGCQRFCTYCIVPYLRGMPKSKKISSIVEEIRLLDKTVKEVILTAINTEAYGYDTRERFIDLLSSIIKETNIPRISLGSIHPWSLSDKFIDFYINNNSNERFVNFLHIPIQSGSNKILRLMKRNYLIEEIFEKLSNIQKASPFSFISTDIIVGFLEENDKDFNDTIDFLIKSPISKFHIFRFSSRNNTAAWYMKKNLTEPNISTKNKRAKILAALSERKSYQFKQKLLNKKFSGLVLERKINEYNQVLLSNQVLGYIKVDSKFIGNIVNLKIFDLKNDQLFGKII